MTLSHYTLRPKLRAALVAFLVHHNPFYLLSALCMVAACFALNNGLAPRAGELPKLLALLGILNGYEFILIALGLYLIRRRGIVRDGRTLLLIEAPFLFDLMFLNAEAGSVSLRVGTVIDVLVMALAILKAAIAFRFLCGRLTVRSFGYIAIALAALFLMPAGFKWIEHRGPVMGVHFYCAWWGVGLLMAAWEFQQRVAPDTSMSHASPTARTLHGVYTALPIVSLVAHLGMLHWVYLVRFTASDLSPIFLRAAVAAGGVLPRSAAQSLRLVLPAFAMFYSLNDLLRLHLPMFGRLDITPALLTCAAAYCVYVYSFFLSRAVYLLAGAAIAALTVAVGPTLAQIEAMADACWKWVCDLADRYNPRTALQWGMAALGGAFGFLAIGAAISLRKTAPSVVVHAAELTSQEGHGVTGE